MAKDEQNDTNAAGRPRSEASKRAVLDATFELLNTTTVRALTIEAIAQKAGVGKTTIYRWWTSKTAVVIDSFIHVMLAGTPIPETKTAEEAIAKHLTLLVKQYNGKLGRVVAETLAEAQFEPQTLANFRRQFFAERRVAVRSVIETGIKNGEFDRKLDVDTALDTIYGAIYFRLFVGHLPLDQDFAKALSKMALTILKPKAKSVR